MSVSPAGWYPDPFVERWWDGAAWTPQSRDEGEAVTPTTVDAATPPGWYSDPYAERWWDGVIWTETARSRWDGGALPATGLVPVVDEPGADQRRAAFVVGGAVAAAILVGVLLALAFGGGKDTRAEITTPSTAPGLPGTPTLPPIVTVDPTRTTATPITLDQSSTSVWNTSLPAPTSAPPDATAPPATSAPAPTAPPAPTTAVPPATTAAPAPAIGNGVAPASATASCQAPDSYASDGTPVTFGPGNTIDGNPATAWRCLIPATNETLTLTFAKEAKLSTVGLIPGYDKVDPVTGEDRFHENYRVKTVRWHFDDGSTADQQLQDSRQMQTMRVKVTTTEAVMEILDVYPPSYPVTSTQYRPYVAVSEVAFTGK